jgi:hypothetical protein
MKTLHARLSTPNLLAADMVHALSQISKDETRRSY